MAELTTLLAEALQWRTPAGVNPMQALARLPETLEGCVLLHQLATILMSQVQDEYGEGGRRLALWVFQRIAVAQQQGEGR